MRIVIAEDQLLLREGLVNVLTEEGFEVVATVADGAEIVPTVLAAKADIALLDIRMPPTHTTEGLVAAHSVRRSCPGYPVMLLSQYVEQLYVDEMLSDDKGGIGYLLKDRVFDRAQFATSLRTVASGGTVVDPQVVAQLLNRRSHTDVLARLTPREHEVLSLMAQGDSNATISSKLVIAPKSVAKHINSLLTKLDLPDDGSGSRRVLAVLSFLRA